MSPEQNIDSTGPDENVEMVKEYKSEKSMEMKEKIWYLENAIKVKNHHWIIL